MTSKPKINIDFDAAKIAKYGIVALAGFAAIFFGIRYAKKGIQKNQQKNSANQVDNKNPKLALAAVLAQRAYAAMVSGFEWVNDWFGDGTNEEELYAIAKMMHSKGITFALVAEAYRKLYPGRTFQSDLSKELDSSELTKFYNKLKGLAGMGNMLPAGSSYTNQLSLSAI